MHVWNSLYDVPKVELFIWALFTFLKSVFLFHVFSLDITYLQVNRTTFISFGSSSLFLLSWSLLLFFWLAEVDLGWRGSHGERSPLRMDIDGSKDVCGADNSFNRSTCLLGDDLLCAWRCDERSSSAQLFPWKSILVMKTIWQWWGQWQWWRQVTAVVIALVVSTTTKGDIGSDSTVWWQILKENTLH